MKKIESFNNTSVTLNIFVIMVFCLCSLHKLTAQNTLSKNNVYFDLGVLPGAQAFVNYERLVHNGKNISWYGRTGMGYGGVDLDDIGTGGLAAMTMLTGKRNSHFEVNIGFFTGKGSSSDNINTSPMLDIGYRYQQPNGGFLFKTKIGILGIGAGLGYSF